MPKGKEITFYEREQIETYFRMKKKKIWIAKKYLIIEIIYQ